MAERLRDPQPLVAIVTPVYNGGAHLRETMRSVQAQTYPNLVHVVLDNASSDDTAVIISDFADQRVPVIAGKNKTVLKQYDNWNAAHDLVPGYAAYIRLLCADDLMEPECTSRMVEVAETDPDILLVGTNVSKNHVPFPLNWDPAVPVLDGKEVIRRFFLNEMGFFAVHMLMRKSVMDWRKPLYDDAYVGADFEAVLGILKRGKFGMVHEQLGFVRIHEASMTSKVMLKKNTHFADFLSALHRHGPDVFGPDTFKHLAERYEMHYLRKSLRWKLQHGSDATQLHFERLKAERGEITLRDYATCLKDWVLIKAGYRKYWDGFPS
ncbi:MAG: glycosyltransferase [Pseudomonadota bacterium]